MGEMIGVIIAAMIGVAAFVGIGVAASISLDRGISRKACEVFSQESGRETKFVEYSFWSWDCLTSQPDGKWISAYNLRGQ